MDSVSKVSMTTFTQFINAHPTIGASVKLAATIVLTILAVTLVLRVEKKIVRKLIAKRENINLRYVESISRFIIIFLAIQWVIMSSSLTQSFGRVLFQGTAVIGAIVGFAAQPVLSDLICGLMISVTKPFDIGDRIELEDGTTGIVKDITFRHVILQDVDSITRIIPNSKLNSMKITNMSFQTQIRSIHLQFNVAYGSDVEKAMAVIGGAVRSSGFSIPGKAGDNGPEYGPVYFMQYEASSLVMATTVYYEPTTPTEIVRSDINSRVKLALEENGIEIPYQYVNVVVHEAGKSEIPS